MNKSPEGPQPPGPEKKPGGEAKHGGPEKPSLATPSVRPPPSGSAPAKIEHVKMELPKGGGAIQSMGEKLDVHPATGTGSFSIPLALTPGRGDLTPKLALSYDSGAGNGPFGLGWSVGVASIRRRTDKRLPTYLDAAERDVFVLAGAEDLVPVLEPAGEGWRRAQREVVEPHGGEARRYTVHPYRPRTEGLFARVERWVDHDGQEAHWRVTTKENATSIYGRSAGARIADPRRPSLVFEWLLEETADSKGNRLRYEYKAEDLAGVEKQLHEARRLSGAQPVSNRYLKRIHYSPFAADQDRFHFQVVFDYGEHAGDTPAESRPWTARPDAFSRYQSGFDVRTYRLCERVLMFHNFPRAPGGPDDWQLVQSTELAYARSPLLTRLRSARRRGYARQAGGEYLTQALPPVELEYTDPEIDGTLHALDPESLRGAPAGLADPAYQWVDLEGEGLSGILTHQAEALFYKRNLGGGRFGPMRRVGRVPALVAGQGAINIADIDGDGRHELLVETPEMQGFYPYEDGQWRDFRPLASRANVDLHDPNLKRIDLDGDGRPDLFVAEEHVYRCYYSRGEEGYEPGIAVARGAGEEQGPTLAFADGSQAVHVADMSGDGLADIVRIRNGEVCYWPNLGHGRFGAKVTMSRAPSFCADERQFDPKLVRLGDWDGSGTTDLFYFGNGKVELWPNQAGNGFGEKRELPGFLPVDSLTSLDVVDLKGTGTQCLVWSSKRPGVGEHQMSYLELLRGKPHLLSSIDNNMGKVVNLSYTPSTVFYREAERAGRPWVTRLPFVVQALSQVETVDEIGRHRHVARYSYHHGYYDHPEREFRGFGMVETIDSEGFETYQGDPAHYVAPVFTRSWYHPGAFSDSGTLSRQFAHEYFQGDPGAFLLPDSVLEGAADLDGDELREAHRALKGSLLRQEIYELGHPVPYQVTEASFTVKALQPREGNAHAVFFVHPMETIESHYEQRANDPRVLHDFVQEVDAFGNVTQACRLAYPRREVGADVRPEQRRGYATVSRNRFINVTEGFYRVGVPEESGNYELNADLLRPRPDEQVSWAAAQAFAARSLGEVIPAGQDFSTERPQARVIGRERHLYWDGPQERAGALGEMTAQALLHHSEAAALNASLLARAYGGAVTEADLLAAGYRRDGDTWWSPGLVQHYTRGGFYLPCRTEDPFGGTTTVEHDRYAMAPEQLTDGLQNVTRVVVDYRRVQPWRLTDPNGSRSEVLTNPLGMVIATSVYGSERGEARGDRPLLGEAGEPIYRVLPASGAPEVLASPERFLQGATSFFFYDLEAWRERGEPPLFVGVAREQHLFDSGPGGAPRMQLSIGVRDGFERSIETKIKAEPGIAWRQQPDHTFHEEWCDERWVASGRIVYNNKGQPVRKYEPFYTASPSYEPEEFFARYGVGPLLTYDPLMRMVRTDLPLGVFRKVAFDAWSLEQFDENDTVRDSEYYARYAELPPEERRALDGAAKHSNTPTVRVVDALGREILTLEYLKDRDALTPEERPACELVTRTRLTISGKPESIVDPRRSAAGSGLAAAAYTYSMTGQVLRTVTLDAGERLELFDALGKPVWQRGARGQEKRTRYDLLQRPVRLEVTRGNEVRVAERSVYGESVPGPEAMNLRGRLYRQYDQAGLVETDWYSFEGEATRTKRRLRKAYAQDADWADGADWSGLLEDEVFTRLTEHDALKRVRLQREPDGSEKTLTYHSTGRLDQVAVRRAGAATSTRIVEGIRYNSKGQREQVTYGNGVVTFCSYEPKTFRLSRIQTLRPADGKQLQDLAYTYDPANNITRIGDGAQQDVFFGNAVVSATGEYEYDSLYRLTRAEGREHPGQQPGSDGAPLEALPHPNDAVALVRYAERYAYDEVGNILSMEHQAGGQGWKRRYRYTGDSNRLLATSLPDDEATGAFSATYAHDAAGNMTRMPHLPDMRWDESERLRAVDRSGGGTVYFVYDSAGERVRKAYEHGGLVDERIYLGGGYEIYRRRGLADGGLQEELQTLHVMDDKRRVALLETRTAGGPVGGSGAPRLRLQLDNHLGSAALELGDAGQVITYEEHHPYGGTSFHSARRDAELAAKRYRYTGKERDEETGLDYFGARYYAPWLGRWTSCDPAPLRSNQEATTGRVDQPYVYVENKPIVANDPDGEAIQLAVVAAIAGRAVAGALVGAALFAGVEAGQQLLDHGEIKDKNKIWAKAAGGAVSGAIAGLTGGASVPVQLLVGAGGGGVLGGIMERNVAGEKQTPQKMAGDAAASMLGFSVAKAFIKIASTFAQTAAKDMGQNAKTVLAEAKEHLNKNTAKSEFGIYVFDVGGEFTKGSLSSLKGGKANLERIVKSITNLPEHIQKQFPNGMPKRIHEQFRWLSRVFGAENIKVSLKNLGWVTTAEAKEAERATLQEIFDKSGKVPLMNIKSFKPK